MDYFEYTKNIFKENGHDFDAIVSSLPMKERNEILVNAHFYYHICLPDKDETDVRQEIRIVGITSLIEKMMEEIDYKDFFCYFENQYKGKNIIEDYKKIKEEYLSLHGASRRIRSYFNSFVTLEDKEAFCDGIEKYNKINFIESKEGKKLYAKFCKLMDLKDLHGASKIDDELKIKNNSFTKISSKSNELPNLLYQMRSDFVHKAEMRGFCPNSSDALSSTIGNNYYNIEVNIKSLLNIFERSFVNFCVEKTKNI